MWAATGCGGVPLVKTAVACGHLFSGPSHTVPGEDTLPAYPSRDQMLRYFEQYAAIAGIAPHIQFGCEVTGRTEPAPASSTTVQCTLFACLLYGVCSRAGRRGGGPIGGFAPCGLTPPRPTARSGAASQRTQVSRRKDETKKHWAARHATPQLRAHAAAAFVAIVALRRVDPTRPRLGVRAATATP